MKQNYLQMKKICKSFDIDQALYNVDFTVKLGTIHGLIGENAAGKSVLMKILSGSLLPDYGDIFLDGKKLNIKKPSDSLKFGISTIYNEINLVSNISVKENILLGKLPKSKYLKKVNWKKANEIATNALKRLESDIDPNEIVRNLDYTQQRTVEIAKVLVNHTKILIVDEAYIGISEYEQKHFLKVLQDLKEQGVTILFVSHNIDEALGLCDNLTILKKGRIVLEFVSGELDKQTVIQAIAGGPVKENYPRIPYDNKRLLLRVDNLSTKNGLNDFSFDLYKGEILGVIGLINSGQHKVGRALFGLEKIDKGTLLLNNSKIKINSPSDAIKHGFGYLPRTMLSESLNSNLRISSNITMANIRDVSSMFYMKKNVEENIARTFIKKFLIKVPSMNHKVDFLSQGSQQKIRLSKWIYATSRILILDEPCIGLDVSSSVDIYNYMNSFILKGNSIIFSSSNIDELMGMSDRILVINKGKLVKCLNKNEYSKEEIIKYATIGTKHIN